MACCGAPWQFAPQERASAEPRLSRPSAKRPTWERNDAFARRIAALVLMALPAAAAEMRGVTATEIRIGQTCPIAGRCRRSARSARRGRLSQDDQRARRHQWPQGQFDHARAAQDGRAYEAADADRELTSAVSRHRCGACSDEPIHAAVQDRWIASLRSPGRSDACGPGDHGRHIAPTAAR